MTAPARLAAACQELRPGTAADAVGGVTPGWVAAPGSVAEASAVLAAAAELDLAVLPRGTGSRLAWGAPPRRCDLVVETRRLDEVLEHAAGDLVVRVQAGVRLGQLAARLGEAGQRLPLDPPGDGTVGGMLAAGVAGPLRLRFGAPRDLLIGITVVRADGTVAKAGGKVVKNVAGYDLGKLFAGSAGTLGLITEAIFRLHPRPAAAAWVSASYSAAAHAARALIAAGGCVLAPAAAELRWPGLDQPLTVAALLEGHPEGVAERAARMADLLTSAGPAPGGTARAGTGPAISSTGPSWWGNDSVAPGGTVLRVAFWPGKAAAVLDAIREAAVLAGVDPAAGGPAAAGVLHVTLPGEVPAGAAVTFVAGLRQALRAGEDGPARASAVVLDAPPAVRDAVDLWGPVPGLELMRAVKDQFDPGHRMAPGRLAGGI